MEYLLSAWTFSGQTTTSDACRRGDGAMTTSFWTIDATWRRRGPSRCSTRSIRCICASPTTTTTMACDASSRTTLTTTSDDCSCDGAPWTCSC